MYKSFLREKSVSGKPTENGDNLINTQIDLFAFTWNQALIPFLGTLYCIPLHHTQYITVMQEPRTSMTVTFLQLVCSQKRSLLGNQEF